MNISTFQLRSWVEWALLATAASIVAVSLWYTDQLVDRLKTEERLKVSLWAEATRIIATSDLSDNHDITYPLSIVSANNTIPVIAALEDGMIIAHRNLDSSLVDEAGYLEERMAKMRSVNEPLITDYEGEKLYFYYENSILYTKLKYYPYVQLFIIGVFIALGYFAISFSRRSEQNLVWVGMSKETAHQLGTPISSLLAWIELLKSSNGRVSEEVITEMSKDMERLELITERFSKIGSEPVLTETNVGEVVKETIEYLKKRLPSKVEFTIEDEGDLISNLNVPLFAWVIENLTKNAVDAMNGKGALTYHIGKTATHVFIDVSDSGKGIPGGRFHTIFEPGFTTKTRGWGLGLSLAKRIIENYHDGSIFVKESVANQGTTFRILLKK